MNVIARPASRRVDLSTAALLAANLLPVAGVLMFDWQILPLMLLFWAENLVIGAWNVLKLMFSRNPGGAQGPFLALFFSVHYGMFCVVHGVFVMTLFGEGEMVESPSLAATLEPFTQDTTLLLAIVALFVSHGISFAGNYIGGREYREIPVSQLMFQPYSRIVVLHVALLVGGFLVGLFDSPLPGLLLLIALKIGLDIRAHRREHLVERT